MKNFLQTLLLLLCLLAPACTSAESSSVLSRVQRVTDGDTLVLENGEKVRLIGVDAPEIHDEENRNKIHAQKYGQDPRRVDEYAVKARNFAMEVILQQKVRLEYDWQRRDKFGRTLAYVYREKDHFFLNAELVKQGYGFAYTRFPFKYLEQFRGYQVEARRNRKGMWG